MLQIDPIKTCGRVLQFVFGAVCLVIAWMTPIHWMSVDTRILDEAGAQGTSSDAFFKRYIDWSLTGPVRFVVDAETQRDILWVIETFETQYPLYRLSGGENPTILRYLETLEAKGFALEGRRQWMGLLANSQARDVLKKQLRTSSRGAVQAILRTYDLSTLTTFLPATTAAGAPYAASVLTAALMAESGYLSPEMTQTLSTWGEQALRGNTAAAGQLESFYLSLLSLAYRMNPVQLGVLLRHTDSLSDLDFISQWVRQRPESLHPLYSAILYQESSEPVVRYLRRYGLEAGVETLQATQKRGIGAVNFLLERQQPLYRPRLGSHALPPPPAMTPWFYEHYTASWAIKCLLLFLGTYCWVAVLLSALAPKRSSTGEKEQVSSGSTLFLRNTLLACFTATLLLTILEGGHTPGVSSNAESNPAGVQFAGIQLHTSNTEITLMNSITTDPITLTILSLFFILQLIIYMLGLIKLGQIRAFPGDSTLKRILLENEENFFDTGLYVGLAGTVASLILLSMNVVSASLVAAYASTLFGILFVAILKIFHVRPYRRSLLLEEANQRQQ